MRRLRILTWHIHGNYLWYLSHAPHDFVLPRKTDGSPGYGGRGDSFPLGDNVTEIPAGEIQREEFDCILFQHHHNFTHDQYEILSPAQRRLPRIFVQHDPPLDHPTDQRHWCADDPNCLLVHVTPFNALMWDSGRCATRVIDHGVPQFEGVGYEGDIARGLVVINHLGSRGRRLGPDIFEQARRQVPLDLVGMESERLGGLGEVPPTMLAQFSCRYRFFFNPIRYTSLGLAVCEAMMLGIPVVGLATTEMATAIQHGVSGFVDTDLRQLIPGMQWLLENPAAAREMGQRAQQYARERFNLERFVDDWNAAFADAAGSSATSISTSSWERSAYVAANSAD